MPKFLGLFSMRGLMTFFGTGLEVVYGAGATFLTFLTLGCISKTFILLLVCSSNSPQKYKYSTVHEYHIGSTTNIVAKIH